VRCVIDYAAPVFFNGLPQYLKNELVRLKKRAISIITSGKCNSAIEVGVTPILEHHYTLCSRLFDSGASARETRQRSTMGKKIKPRKFGMTSAYERASVRPSVQNLGEGEGEGEERLEIFLTVTHTGN